MDNDDEVMVHLLIEEEADVTAEEEEYMRSLLVYFSYKPTRLPMPHRKEEVQSM